MEQKLVFIDLELAVVNFYNIKIEKNKNQYYLIVSTGKIGNKGTTTLVYKGSDYGYCKKEFWRRVNNKKTQKYKNMEDILPQINKIFSLEKNSYLCDVCKKELGKRLYYKIDNYLRNETIVDSDDSHPLNNKIACFDCQIKYGVFKGKNAE